MAVSASCRSGSVTISTSGVPPRLKSTSVAVAPCSRPDSATWMFFAASSSRCARVMPIVTPPSSRRHDELPARAERLVVLADLVRLRQVGIEVVLAVEDRALGDLAVEREPELDRLLDRAPVRHGQRAGEGEADRADVASSAHRRRRSRQRQNIFVFVFSCTWISSPITGSQVVVALIAGAPGRCRSRARPRAHARRGRACSRRTAGRSAAGRPAAPPRARTGC